ncbi:uncharacterized protein PHACADRAFT_197592 [Phanerochaete carnosa HHB-10118-sp]|uniref:Uncharacterized protein n=1 Tax=Phanerochaete carnosa (strain HHB-10118-sp) TaxID=650164 RepID=K5W2L8_PHACS|nr:uncharacterized protein PHACADRAFT_197592 [Phanerochaete carnosa HHB-10118-sp]EKM53169.1 hypothetical protein PHACADRAFT_197592 [Phanerochaete carnosa HHB-10118-sp]
MDIITALERSRDLVWQRIPIGWVLHIDEVFDDIPQSHMDKIQERLEKRKREKKKQKKKAKSPITPCYTKPITEAPPSKHIYHPAPSIRDAKAAHTDLSNLLQPKKKSRIGYLHFNEDDHL